jgi:hypothetical protein
MSKSEKLRGEKEGKKRKSEKDQVGGPAGVMQHPLSKA